MSAKSSKGGLGMGLGAIFGDDYAAEQQPKDIATLPIMKVEPRKDQPRYRFDEVALEELADSIRQYGLIQPVTVRQLDGGYYQIIAGERRWRASRMAGLDEIPVRIIEADDKKAMELALVENLQREDLNPIEEARGYKTLMEEYGMTQEEASNAVGKSRPAVTNALRLLSLDESVMTMVESGELSAGHARALLGLKQGEKQREIAAEVIKKHLSVRQTESLVARLAKAKTPEETKTEEEIVVDYVREVERDLENLLGRKVKLVDSKKKGKIEIEFYGADDREKLIKNLMLLGKLNNK
ncbi:MAG: ParB/RepB/Spo0J family partition protein [Oscillospiraceae bacterium]|nr:ParB/RepB/Spo0J family partition protein [Oscillospiraceae bacterium]